MKLTNEILEKMILEEVKKLDEKTFPFDANKLSGTGSIFGNNKKKTGETDAELKKRIAALAQLDQNAADVSIDDLRIGATKPQNSDEYKVIVNLKDAGANPYVRNIAAQALAKKLPAKTGIGDEKLGTGQAQQAAETEPSAGESIPALDMDYSAVDLKSDLQAKVLQTGGKLDQAVVDALGTFFSIDPAKLGSNMSANTLGGRFDLLSKFALLVEADDVNTLKQLQSEELMAAAVAFKALASVFIKSQGASAGTVFETLIALITGGGIFGGESGAIDNIAGKNGDVYTSAKQYADKHHTAQATGTLLKDGGKGLIAHCQQAYKNGKKVWYISAKKMERELEIIFGGISVDNPDNPKTFIFYKPNGDESGDTMPVKKNKSSSQNNFTKFIEAAAKGQEMRIPIIDAGEARKVANVDKMIADALTNLNKAFLTAAMESSKEVDLLTKQNLSYTTEKNQAPSAAKAAEIKLTYTRLKNAFNTMFGQKHQTQIAEHKNEKLTEEILDKLIKAVIL